MGSYKTPRNCSPIFSFIWVGSGQVIPLRHPNPTPTSPTCTKWAELARSLIQVHSIPFFEGHLYKQMGRVTMWAHLQFESYKLMHLLGIHSSSTIKNYEWTIIIMSRCTLELFSYILMYTLIPSKLYIIQHYKCIHNYISYKINITGRPWTHLY